MGNCEKCGNWAYGKYVDNVKNDFLMQYIDEIKAKGKTKAKIDYFTATSKGSILADNALMGFELTDSNLLRGARGTSLINHLTGYLRTTDSEGGKKELVPSKKRPQGTMTIVDYTNVPNLPWTVSQGQASKNKTQQKYASAGISREVLIDQVKNISSISELANWNPLQAKNKREGLGYIMLSQFDSDVDLRIDLNNQDQTKRVTKNMSQALTKSYFSLDDVKMDNSFNDSFKNWIDTHFDKNFI